MSNAAAESYFNDNTKGFLQSVDDNIDAAIQTFIFDVYSNLIADYRVVIINLAILSILFYSFQLYKGRVGTTLEEVSSQLLKIVIVFGLLFKMDSFIMSIHTVFMEWPEELIRSIVRSMNGVTIQTMNQDAIKGTLDVYLEQSWKLGLEVMKIGSIANIFPWLIGLWIIVLGFILSVIPFGLAAIANVSTAVLLSLTPIFLVFYFFKKTTGFFEAWIRSMMTMVFLKILAYSVMVLSIFIMKHPIADMIDTVGVEGDFRISNYMAYLISGFVIYLFYRNISSMAAGLGSGFTVQASRIAETATTRLGGYLNKK